MSGWFANLVKTTATKALQGKKRWDDGIGICLISTVLICGGSHYAVKLMEFDFDKVATPEEVDAYHKKVALASQMKVNN